MFALVGLVIFLVILHLLVRSTEKTIKVKVPQSVMLTIDTEASASLPSDSKH